MVVEPKYDEDVVNLGYLKKIVADPEGNLENIYENVSKHYASKPQPPYHKGDTWIDGNIIYTCINDREIGIYQDSDWTTESGAREEAERKNKVFLRQPSNYSVGDMWILQSDEDHKAGKKGEILISTAGRKEYDEGDWINMLGYGTIRSINEVANNINDALQRLNIEKEEGIITIFYCNTIPENPILDDLWYVTETINDYTKGNVYKYNGENWEIIADNLIMVAFEEANQDRLISDGKIQSFYTSTEPLENIGVGDIWTNTSNKRLYRYNGTNWVAVYDTNINEIRRSVETVTERTVKIETDLGKITQEVKEVETTVETVKTTAEDAKTQVIETKERVGTLEIDVDNITQSVSSVETTLQDVEEQTNLNIDEIANLGSTETVEGQTIEVNASNNPAKLQVYGNTEQADTPTSAIPKNIRNCGDNINRFNEDDVHMNTGATLTGNADNVVATSGSTTTVYAVIKVNPNKRVYLKGHNESAVAQFYVGCLKNQTTEAGKTSGSWIAGNGYIDTTADTQYLGIVIRQSGSPTMTLEVLKNLKIKIEEGSVATPYTPYDCGSIDIKVKNEDNTQNKIIQFPFTEGQVLHKGDYLAEDGIHQSKGTLVLDGTENWVKSSSREGNYYVRWENLTNKGKTFSKFICNYAECVDNINEYVVGKAFSDGSLNLWFDNGSMINTVDLWKSYLAEQYANGTPVTIEYELAEKVLIPYTPEQQKVLDSIETFKGINHIYCIDEITPEKMILTYYPNTPYNDTLVNKDTFDKVTTEMNAEFNIKANEIETSVKEQTTASILTLLNNNYLSAEQVNALVEGNTEDIATVKEQLTQTVTSSQMQIEITKAIEGGVSYLKNTLFTIDENGMAIATSEDEFNALYNNKGMYLYSYEEMIAKFDVDGTTIEGNLILEGEFITPNLRMMNAEVDGVPHTHIHWIGG